MSFKNSLTQYGSLAQFFHWIIFLLILIMIPLGYFMFDISDKVLRGQAINIHKLIGLFILTLMILRALWALSNVKPSLPPDTPLWQRWSERGLHWLLYIGFIVMPFSGWVGSVAGGKPPHLEHINIELPVAKSKALSDFAFNIHNSLVLVLIVLVVIHIFAALYHHFIKKDNILRRMLLQRE